MNATKELLSIRDVMRIMKVSRMTVWRRVKAWNITIIRENEYFPRFDAQEIYAAMEARNIRVHRVP